MISRTQRRGPGWLRWSRPLSGALVTSLLAAVLLVAGSGASATAAASATPVSGGTLTVLESSDAASWATGLYPPTSQDLADTPYLDAIYGALFLQGNSGSVIPDLATGYKFSDGARVVSIFLRHGVSFTDGTPFNAGAVASDIRADLDPANACACLSSFPVSSVTTTGDYTVVLHMTKPFSPIIGEFPGAAPNWVFSPAAFQKMGATQFANTPVGAGPFEVVSDTYNSVLELKKNPNYWQKGHPYLDGLTFKAVGSDESGYEGVLAGSAQLAENVGTPSLIPEAKKALQVTEVIGREAVSAVELNDSVAPFNNIVAREAVEYATNAPAISKALSAGVGQVVESPSLPGSVFYQPTVPGYRTYDLAKAEALVKQLGGLSVNLATPSGNAAEISEALQSEWQAAGIKVDLNVFPDLPALLTAFKSNTWQALTQGAGGLNPAIGTGSSYWRYYSSGPYTGTHDPKLDKLVDQAAATTSQAQQVAIYKKVDAYLSKQADIDMLYLSPLYDFASKSANGPGLSTPREFPDWPDVWLSK